MHGDGMGRSETSLGRIDGTYPATKTLWWKLKHVKGFELCALDKIYPISSHSLTQKYCALTRCRYCAKSTEQWTRKSIKKQTNV